MTDLLEIRDTEKAGRGLFSRCMIQSQTILFIAPTIRVPGQEYNEHCKFTVFENYLFKGRSGDSHLALHLGSIFNHSKAPNVIWVLDEKRDEIRFQTFRTIAENEELFISYGAWGKQYEIEEGEGGGEQGQNEDDDEEEASDCDADFIRLFKGK